MANAPLYTLKLDVQTPAKVAGIHNAAQLAKACGLHNAPAYALWKGEQTRFNLTTLTALVNALHCELSDILIRVRAPRDSQALPGQALAATKARISPPLASPAQSETGASAD